jgi:hypothetical protein
VQRGKNAGEELHPASVLRVLQEDRDYQPQKDVPFSRRVAVGADSQGKPARVVFEQGEKKSRQKLGAPGAPWSRKHSVPARP